MDSVYTKKTSDLSGSPPRTPESDSKRRSRSKHKSKSRNKSKLRRKSRSSRKSTGGTQSSKIAALNPLAVKVQDLRRRCEKDIRFVNNQLNNVLTAGYTTVIKRLALSEEIFKASLGLLFWCGTNRLGRVTFLCNAHAGQSPPLSDLRGTQETHAASVQQVGVPSIYANRIAGACRICADMFDTKGTLVRHTPTPFPIVLFAQTPAPHRIRYTKKSANNQTDTGEDHPTPHKHRQSFKIAVSCRVARSTIGYCSGLRTTNRNLGFMSSLRPPLTAQDVVKPVHLHTGQYHVICSHV